MTLTLFVRTTTYSKTVLVEINFRILFCICGGSTDGSLEDSAPPTESPKIGHCMDRIVLFPEIERLYTICIAQIPKNQQFFFGGGGGGAVTSSDHSSDSSDSSVVVVVSSVVVVVLGKVDGNMFWLFGGNGGGPGGNPGGGGPGGNPGGLEENPG